MAAEHVFGATTAWVSDIDKGACKVLAHRYPGVPNLGDITTIDWSTVEPVDIIAGGSPCQDLSTAGRRAGMTDGTRSNLWVQMREAIAHVQPTFVIWENVRGALSAEAASALEHCPGCMGDPRHGGPALRALGRVLGDLADLGYDTQWHGLRAADVGACHGRWRVFVMAWPADPDLAGLQGLADHAGASQARRHGHAEPGVGRPDLALLPTPKATNNENRQNLDQYGMNLGQALGITPKESHDGGVTLLPTPRATDGTKGGPNQRGSKGDLMLPSAVHQLLPTPRATRGGSTTETVELLPTPKAGDADFGLPRTSGRPPEKSTHLATRLHYTDFGQYAAAITRHEQNLGRPAPDPTEPGTKGNPRLSPAFVEWMMMLPAGWITDVPGITRNEALRLCGNGVVPPQAVAALRDMTRHITPWKPAARQEPTA